MKNDDGAVRRFWRSVRLGALLPYVVLGALLLVAIVIVGRDIDHHIDAIEAWLNAISPWGAVAFFALFVVLSSLFVERTARNAMQETMAEGAENPEPKKGTTA